MSFILFRSISITFLFPKTKFRWIILFRKKLDEICPKFGQKQIKHASGKVKTDNKIFCKSCGPAHGLTLSAHGPHERAALICRSRATPTPGTRPTTTLLSARLARGRARVSIPAVRARSDGPPRSSREQNGQAVRGGQTLDSFPPGRAALSSTPMRRSRVRDSTRRRRPATVTVCRRR